jgi:protoheme IX farnesyltransferase
MENSPGKIFSHYLELAKVKIMVPVSFTGFAGYFIFDPHFSAGIFLITLGIFLLAVAAAVLNQIQEASIDGKMNRTRNRPLPSKKITIRQAAYFFFFCLGAGTVIIWTQGNLSAAMVGFLTIIWYNGVYTYLKKITAFAVIPGAITGALPPLVGWVAAGGGLCDKPIIFIGFLLFTGQIPHFWLLILKYGEEYKKAGIPNLTDLFSHAQIKRLTFTWVLTAAIASIFLCYFEIIKTRMIIVILILASALLILRFSELLRLHGEGYNYRKYFLTLDLYYLLVLFLLVSDRIIT